MVPPDDSVPRPPGPPGWADASGAAVPAKRLWEAGPFADPIAGLAFNPLRAELAVQTRSGVVVTSADADPHRWFSGSSRGLAWSGDDLVVGDLEEGLTRVTPAGQSHVAPWNLGPIWAIAAGGKDLAVSLGDGWLTLVDPASSNLTRLARVADKPLHAVAWSHDGRRLAAGDGSGTVWIRSPTLRPLVRRTTHGGAVRCVGWTADDRFVVAAGSPGNDVVAIVDSSTGRMGAGLLDGRRGLTGVDLAHAAPILAYGAPDAACEIYLLNSDKPVMRALTVPPGRNRWQGPVFHPTRPWVAVPGAESRTVTVWDLSDAFGASGVHEQA